MVMNSWYDITSLGSREINSEVHDSAARILRVMSDLPPQPLYIGGFSQGAAMSLFVGLQNQDLPIRGVVALSGYCFPINVAEARAQTPVFLYHGLDDAVIPEVKARMSYEAALSRAVKTYKTEAGLEHSVSFREIADLQQWLLAQFAAESVATQ
jgi:predicted esterase